MAMGQDNGEQPTLFLTYDKVRGLGHPFYDALDRLLREQGFDRFVEGLCELHYAEVMGRPGLAPGVYFRCLLIGYFEGISSERASPGGSSRTSWRVSTPDDAGGPLAGHWPASLDGSPWRARAGWARHDATRNAVPGARSSVHAPSAPVLTALTASRSSRSAVTISTSTGGDGFEGDPTRRVCSIRTFDYKDNELGHPACR